MSQLVELSRGLIVLPIIAGILLPSPVAAQALMTTTADNATNPTALQNLTGGILTYSGNTLTLNGRIREGDMSFTTLFPNPNNVIVAAQRGSSNAPIVGAEYNDLPNNTNSLPAGIIGYGKLDPTKTGNQVFGVFGLAENPTAAGAAIGAEFTCRNSGGAPDTALPPNLSIGTPTISCTGLHVTSGGTFDSSIGIRVSREGQSSVNFNTGIYIKDYTQYGLYVANQSGATNAIYSGGPVAIDGALTVAGHVTFEGVTSTGATGTGPLVFGTMPTLTSATLTDAVNKEYQVSTSTLSKTDTTPVNIPGLSQVLTAGKTYSCHGHLSGTAPSAGGIKVNFATTDTLTRAYLLSTGTIWNGATVVAKNTPAGGLNATIVSATSAYTDIDIDAAIVVDAGGTIVLRAAQNVASGTTTVSQGSTFNCVRVN